MWRSVFNLKLNEVKAVDILKGTVLYVITQMYQYNSILVLHSKLFPIKNCKIIKKL
jgi:hypothetical protein